MASFYCKPPSHLVHALHLAGIHNTNLCIYCTTTRHTYKRTNKYKIDEFAYTMHASHLDPVQSLTVRNMRRNCDAASAFDCSFAEKKI